MTKPISFDPVLLAALAPAMADEDVRYFLRGIRFEGKYGIATDGTVMTVAVDPKANNKLDKGIAAVRFTDKRAITRMKSAKLPVLIDPAEKIVSVETPRGREDFLCAFVEGEYPPWQRIMPSEREIKHDRRIYSDLVMEAVQTTAKLLRSPVEFIGVNKKLSLVRYMKDERIFSLVVPYTETPLAEPFDVLDALGGAKPKRKAA